MQKLLIVFIALFIGLSSIAQVNLDSLWNVWNDKSQPDTNRLKAMHKIAWDGYLFSQPDSAFYFAGLQYDFAESVNNKKQMAGALTTQGVSFKRSDYAKAIDYYTRSLNIREELGDKKGTAMCLNNIGILYKNQGDYAKAMDYYTRNLKIREELGDKKGIASSLNNIGTIYYEQGDYAKAKDYYIRCLKIYEERGSQRGIAYILGNIGNIYYEQGDYAKATDYYTRSSEICEEIGDKKGTAMCLNNIGNIYIAQGDYAKALEKCRNSLSIAQETGAVEAIKEPSGNLWKIHKKLGKHRQALEMHELYIEMRDSILSIENKEAIIQQEFKYKYEKQAAADSVVNAEADKVKNAQLAAEKAENKQHILEASQQKQQKYFLYGILALALLFGGFIFNRFRVANKQKNLIGSQHQKLNETHREITDSINYAKKIQDAIMTSSVYIQEVLPESFIFFQPKDVVSGDFYWVHQSPTGHIYFTVADCTGHGVPGAFMSMIGTALLNENIIENGVEDPAQVLNNLREQIIKALKQESQSESRDGMDMVLCRLDPKKRTLEFAGAFNPVIHIRDNKLTQIKADSQPVALYPGNRTPFSKQTIDLNKGDMIYIFSDGFADQFGGKKDKKYLRSKFYDFLLSISAAPTKQQQQALETEFISWKGENEQIDDVCVMGVRV